VWTWVPSLFFGQYCTSWQCAQPAHCGHAAAVAWQSYPGVYGGCTASSAWIGATPATSSGCLRVDAQSRGDRSVLPSTLCQPRQRWRLRNAKLARPQRETTELASELSPQAAQLEQQFDEWDQAPPTCDAGGEQTWDEKIKEVIEDEASTEQAESDAEYTLQSAASIGGEWDMASTCADLAKPEASFDDGLSVSTPRSVSVERSSGGVSWADIVKRHSSPRPSRRTGSVSSSSSFSGTQTHQVKAQFPTARSKAHCHSAASLGARSSSTRAHPVRAASPAVRSKTNRASAASFGAQSTSRLAALQGHWAGRGEIRGSNLLWKHGPSTRIWPMANGQITVRLDGQVHYGELKGNELHWDDGDIWSRSVELEQGFEGRWPGRGEIRGKTLFWRDGPAVTLELAGRDIELCLDGTRHHGMLKEDGKLHWDDGDIWSREAGERESEKFGFGLFAEVRLAVEVDRLQAGAMGTVVGFSEQHVQVKFVGRICRCLPEQLHKSPSEAGNERRSWCTPDSARQQPKPRQNLETVRCSSVAGGATDCANPVPAKQTWAARLQTRTAAASPAQAKLETGAKVQMCTVADSSSSASEKQTASSASGRTATAPTKASEASTKWFHGAMTWSRGSMGWVDCQELREEFPERNIFLHRSEWSGSTMPRQQDRIMFRLEVDSDGNPKAVQAKPEASETEGPQRLTLAQYRQSLSSQHGRNLLPSVR